MHKKRNIIFGLLFSMVITFTGFYIMFIKPPVTKLTMDLRNAVQFIGPTIQNVNEGFFQSSFESAFQDQFVKREKLIQVYRIIEHELYSLSLPNKSDMTLVKIGEDVYTFRINEDYLTGWPIMKNNIYEEGIDKFTNNVNQISEKYKDVNFYVYKPFRITEANWFDVDNDFKSYGEIYTEQFKNSLNSRILYSDNKINDFEMYKKFYYKTDPHWNIFGSYEGYRSIVDMFNVNYDGSIIPHEYDSVFTFENFDFYGQYGRNSSYLTSADTFSDLNFSDLPSYETIVNGNLMKYDKKEEFKNNTIEEFYWHYIYSVYHGNDEAEVIFKENINTGRKLLCFVDSYSSPIKHLIASHFDEAIFIDPRINNNFNFREFMEENNVTDVMYMGFYGSLYADSSYIFEDF